MGGRTAMTLAAKFPHRIDGIISVEAAPFNETIQTVPYGPLAQKIMNHMIGLLENHQLTKT